MKTFLRNMLPGFWLMAALPISALILVPIGEVFNMGSDMVDPILAIGFATGHLIVGYLWSRTLLRRAGISASRLAKLAAGIGFAFSIIMVEVRPTILDSLPKLVGVQGTTHLEFKVIFVIWTGFATGLTGLALGLGLKRWLVAVKLLAAGVLTGSAVFLVVALLMDVIGFRVGVPRANGIPSMPAVTALGIWLAALFLAVRSSLIYSQQPPLGQFMALPGMPKSMGVSGRIGSLSIMASLPLAVRLRPFPAIRTNWTCSQLAAIMVCGPPPGIGMKIMAIG